MVLFLASQRGDFIYRPNDRDRRRRDDGLTETSSGNSGARKARVLRTAKQNTKSRITNGACDLFVRSGFHGTSMRDVADRVGLRASSLYRPHITVTAATSTSH
jgi:hypothetical protein